jgi:RNA polymerase sigma-70 factor (ECF subfamily)
MEQRSDRDEWLMAQTALGKREPLEALIRRHASPLLTFIQQMVGDRHRSEELFQEVFLAVWIKRRQYQFPRPFRAWLYTIAVNKCREAFRQCDGRRPVVLEEDSPASPLAAGPSPADTAVATETAALITAAVAQLPAQQRVVVVLRIWEGLPYAEIAEITGRTEGTVRSHMHHGLAQLRTLLEPRLNRS